MLPNQKLEGASLAVPVALEMNHRCARLVIPAPELGKIKAQGVGLGGPGCGGRILHRLNKVFTGGGTAVMTAHVQRHAAHEGLLPQQGVEAADHLGSLFIDGGGVKVVDGLVGIGLNWVGCGARVFPKLGVAQHRHVFDAVQAGAVHVGTEALIAKNGEPFFEGQLKPVATGDAVAGPVVKVLMADHTFDALELTVGGRFSIGEHQL